MVLFDRLLKDLLLKCSIAQQDKFYHIFNIQHTYLKVVITTVRRCLNLHCEEVELNTPVVRT